MRLWEWRRRVEAVPGIGVAIYSSLSSLSLTEEKAVLIHLHPRFVIGCGLCFHFLHFLLVVLAVLAVLDVLAVPLPRSHHSQHHSQHPDAVRHSTTDSETPSHSHASDERHCRHESPPCGPARRPAATDSTDHPPSHAPTHPCPHAHAAERWARRGRRAAATHARDAPTPHARSHRHCPRTPTTTPRPRSTDPRGPATAPTRGTPSDDARATPPHSRQIHDESMRSHPTATTTHAPPHALPPQGRPHLSARLTHSTRSHRDTERIARAGSVCVCGTAPDAASSTPHIAHTHPRGGSTRPTSTATRCSAPARTHHSPRTPSPPTTSPPYPARPATDSHTLTTHPPRPRTTRGRSRDAHCPPHSHPPFSEHSLSAGPVRTRMCCTSTDSDAEAPTPLQTDTITDHLPSEVDHPTNPSHGSIQHLSTSTTEPILVNASPYAHAHSHNCTLLRTHFHITPSRSFFSSTSRRIDNNSVHSSHTL